MVIVGHVRRWLFHFQIGLSLGLLIVERHSGSLIVNRPLSRSGFKAHISVARFLIKVVVFLRRRPFNFLISLGGSIISVELDSGLFELGRPGGLVADAVDNGVVFPDWCVV